MNLSTGMRKSPRSLTKNSEGSILNLNRLRNVTLLNENSESPDAMIKVIMVTIINMATEIFLLA